MIWLGIETSCDDTSVAVVKNGREILSNLISSQTDIHKIYGGVVPEIASRKHLENLNPVIEQALIKAKINWKDVEGVCVSNGPGLIGSLLVGVSAAKTISALLDIPLVGVNHLSAHIYANFLHYGEIELPAIALLISGGHTSLVKMSDHGAFELLGETRDDAAGECFDKAARIMGLPYPGGPEIDRLSKTGDKSKIKFPKAFWNDNSYEFSFSGLKTAVMQYYRKNPDECINDICASLQEAVADILVRKTINAAKNYKINQIMIAGGVACNSAVREKLTEECSKNKFQLLLPPPVLCTDNAAMVATCAHYDYERGIRDTLSLDASPIMSWDDIR